MNQIKPVCVCLIIFIVTINICVTGKLSRRSISSSGGSSKSSSLNSTHSGHSSRSSSGYKSGSSYSSSSSANRKPVTWHMPASTSHYHTFTPRNSNTHLSKPSQTSKVHTGSFHPVTSRPITNPKINTQRPITKLNTYTQRPVTKLNTNTQRPSTKLNATNPPSAPASIHADIVKINETNAGLQPTAAWILRENFQPSAPTLAEIEGRPEKFEKRPNIPNQYAPSAPLMPNYHQNRPVTSFNESTHAGTHTENQQKHGITGSNNGSAGSLPPSLLKPGPVQVNQSHLPSIYGWNVNQGIDENINKNVEWKVGSSNPPGPNFAASPPYPGGPVGQVSQSGTYAGPPLPLPGHGQSLNNPNSQIPYFGPPPYGDQTQSRPWNGPYQNAQGPGPNFQGQGSHYSPYYSSHLYSGPAPSHPNLPYGYPIYANNYPSYYAPPPPPPGYAHAGYPVLEKYKEKNYNDLLLGLTLWQMSRGSRSHRHYIHVHSPDNNAKYNSQPVPNEYPQQQYLTYQSNYNPHPRIKGSHNTIIVTYFVSNTTKENSTVKGTMACRTTYNLRAVRKWANFTTSEFHKQFPNETFPEIVNATVMNYTLVSGKVIHNETAFITCCGTKGPPMELHLLASGHAKNVNCLNMLGQIPFRKITFVKNNAISATNSTNSTNVNATTANPFDGPWVPLTLVNPQNITHDPQNTTNTTTVKSAQASTAPVNIVAPTIFLDRSQVPAFNIHSDNALPVSKNNKSESKPLGAGITQSPSDLVIG